MTVEEVEALAVLSQSPDETYELYVLRIAHAEGEPGRLARQIELADIEVHLRCPAQQRDRPYAWARRHLAIAQERCGALTSSGARR
jgi:hypothetical protein